jgi:hypothetical protein
MERFQLLKAPTCLNFFKHKVQEPVPDTFSEYKSALYPRPRPDNRPGQPHKKPVESSFTRHVPSSEDITMHITIDSENIGALRRAAMTCGEALSSIRVQPIPKTKRINVWLYIHPSVLDKIMGAIMRTISNAQFGQFKKYGHAAFIDGTHGRSFNRKYSFMEEASWPED